MAPGDICHGPRCSLAGLGLVALEYRSCHWPGGSAGSPQCVRPMGYWFFPVPRLPYVCAASWAVSAVLCLPACLCVLTAASRGQAPHGNASKVFHRRGITRPPRATRGLRGVRAAPQPRGLQDHHGARSAAHSIALSAHGSAATVKEVDRPGLPHQRVPSADQYRPHSQPRHPPLQPHRSNRFNNHHQGPQDQVRHPLPW